jgi:hypothetical protein
VGAAEAGEDLEQQVVVQGADAVGGGVRVAAGPGGWTAAAGAGTVRELPVVAAAKTLVGPRHLCTQLPRPPNCERIRDKQCESTAFLPHEPNKEQGRRVKLLDCEQVGAGEMRKTSRGLRKKDPLVFEWSTSPACWLLLCTATNACLTRPHSQAHGSR